VTVVKFGVKVRTWDILPRPYICKNCLRKYTLFWASIYQKLPIFVAVSPDY